MFYWSRKTFEILGFIYSNSEISVQFLKQNAFLTCSWKFLRSNTLQQLVFKLEKITGNLQNHLFKSIKFAVKDFLP